ncbi:MAG: protein translocase SEC61 complex subunit gamma [Candidatus Bathyarchaeota archaeon]|nr:MAG: protein translocase SEC61 complex subunit gamma [Candidatus Bathyarchaeota archaeon]
MELREFITSCRRVLTISKKPSGNELQLSVKISALGLLLIGGVAFIIRFASAMIQGFTAP